MRFGDKLKEKRKEVGLSQGKLANEIGVTMRTMRNYEKGTSYPKDRSIYFKLADFFGVDVNYFLTENEEFITAAASYGKKGQVQAQVILEQATALFAGGELSESDRDGFIRDMQRLYLQSKEIAQAKYTPKKYRKKDENNNRLPGQSEG